MIKLIINTLVVCVTISLYSFPVKVLLQEGQGVVSINSKRGFELYDTNSKNRKKIPQPRPTAEIKVSFKKDYMYVNGKRYEEKTLVLKPVSQHFSLEKNNYDGYCLITHHKGQWYIINVLESEDYVLSVLKTEGWPNWPVEVYKVFAVAVRTYVLHHYLQNKKLKLPYHIKNTNYHQTYSGVHNCPVSKEAVQATQGVIMTHDSKPILAMFDSCCGGVIPAHIEGIVDFSKAPYLARSYACTFCKGYKIFSWSHECTLQELCSLLQQNHPTVLQEIETVEIDKRHKAGTVKELVITAKSQKKNKGQKIHFVASLFSKALKKLKSLMYSIEQKGEKVIFKGQGYGHHMGLCQWGTRELVKQGWEWDEILSFYYPGIDFNRLD